MKLIYDGIIYSQPPAGISIYFDEILSRMPKYPDTEVELIMPRSAVQTNKEELGITVKESVVPKASHLSWKK